MADRIEMQLKVLMLAGLSGDAEAHRQLLTAAASRLRSYFGRRIGSDAADVEDLVQETLIAIHSFTKSLALSLGKRSIRVKCVIPGPVWTPNIPGTMPPDEVENFGHEGPARPARAARGTCPGLCPARLVGRKFHDGALVEVTGGRLSAA